MPRNPKSPPSHLGRQGRVIWRRFVDGTNDRLTLEVLASTYERWLAAKADIEKNGCTLVGGTGPKTNPAVLVEEKSARIILSCQKKLGIDSIEDEPDELDLI